LITLRLRKVATADNDAFAAVPKNTWSGPQQCFGWITMPTVALADLYSTLDMFALIGVVGQSSGRPGAFWRADD